MDHDVSLLDAEVMQGIENNFLSESERYFFFYSCKIFSHEHHHCYFPRCVVAEIGKDLYFRENN